MTAADKKAAALSLVEECSLRLQNLSEAGAVREMVTSLAARAWELRGDPMDRPYFTRTLSRLAHALRARGWVEIACGVLEWAMARGTALATAFANAGDLVAVDHLLDLARRSGLMTARLAMTAIRGRLNHRQFGAARRILEDVKREGLADAQCYQSVIAACHRAGRHREAKRALASAASDTWPTADDLKSVKAHWRSRRARADSSEAPIAA